MRRLRRLGAAAIMILAAACASSQPPPPAGLLTSRTLPAWLFCADHDAGGNCTVYRSAQPTKAEFAALRDQLGIKSVIKLSSALEGRDELPDGVEEYAHPWLPAGPVDHDDVASALADLAEAPRPVLVHCLHGEDRTGLLIGLWHFRHGSWAMAAWGEMLAFGFHPALLGLKAAYERETNWKPEDAQ